MTNGDEQTSIRRFTNPAVPFVADIPGGVFPGKVILLKFIAHEESSGDRRITIDLCCGRLVYGDHRDDKALHISIRFDASSSWFSKPDRDIVLNSLTNNVWGPEQRIKNCVEIEKPSAIRILILRDYLKIAVNGKHLCDYIHRLPIASISCLYVTGCARLGVIEFQGETVPIVQNIRGGFLPPRQLHVVFTPKMDAAQIVFNLNVDMEYLLHVRIDFPHTTADKKGAIVRNSTREGVWLGEERRLTGKFPLLPGITSDIHIIAESNSAKIVIDGNLIDVFEYRTGSGSVRPIEVNRLSIIGDLTVQKFEFKTTLED